MFAKLLKYDFRAVGKVWWLLALGLLGVSVGGGFSLRDIILNIDKTDYVPIGVMGVLLTYAAFVAFALVTYILLFMRYYKNFFTDEGYLTFTLPVSRTKLFWSKTLNAMIWNVLTTIVIVAGIIIILGIAPTESGKSSLLAYIFPEIISLFKEIPDDVVIWLILWTIELFILVIVGTLFSTLLIQFCITFGAIIAKKAKIVVSLALAYASSIIMGFIYTAFTIFFPLWIQSVDILYPINMNGNTEPVLVTLGLLLLCVILTVVSVLMYLITVTSLERKLNLA